MKMILKLLLLITIPCMIVSVIVAICLSVPVYKLGVMFGNETLSLIEVAIPIAVRASIFGLFIGGIGALGIGLLHHWSAKKVAKSKGMTDRKVGGLRQKRTIEVEATLQQTFDLCIQSLDLITGSIIQINDRANGKIVARIRSRVGVGLWTITFTVKQIDLELTSVKVVSKPAWYIVADFGRNMKEMQTITDFLQGRSGDHF